MAVARLTIALALGTTAVKAQAGYSSLPYSFITPANHSCVVEPALLSCPSADPMEVDSCCTETFGGLVLATQFWDTYTGLESEGQLLPEGSWTLHGLWPDFCNGSYTGYCSIERNYDPFPSPNVSSTGVALEPYTGNVTGTNVLNQFEKYDLLDYMNKYWVSQGSSSDSFWMHEYSKHATCYSNYQTECWGPDYVEHEEIPAFFENAIGAFKMFDTYSFLQKAGITPSNSTTYTLNQIQAALYNATGATPYLGCSGPRYNTTSAGNGTSDGGRTYISEVWYGNHAYGRIQDLNFTAVDNLVPSSCANSTGAIHYPLRANVSERAV